jgi:hypothetical protein
VPEELPAVNVNVNVAPLFAVAKADTWPFEASTENVPAAAVVAPRASRDVIVHVVDWLDTRALTAHEKIDAEVGVP